MFHRELLYNLQEINIVCNAHATLPMLKVCSVPLTKETMYANAA